MPRITFTLRIEGPEEIADDEVAAIKEAKETHDSWQDGIVRWMSDYANEYVSALSAALPEGWYAKLDGGDIYQEPRRVDPLDGYSLDDPKRAALEHPGGLS